MRVVQAPHHNARDAVARTEYDQQGSADAAHIASWHPAVALAVADWLDDCARLPATTFHGQVFDGRALAVARAYLGEQS
jgi:hypothetical protein